MVFFNQLSSVVAFNEKKRGSSFNTESTDAIFVLQAALKEILPSLRLLQSKTRLQFADLQYVLCTSPISCGPDAAIMLGRLLMLFLCNAVGGHLVLRSVVQMASRNVHKGYFTVIISVIARWDVATRDRLIEVTAWWRSKLQ